MRTLFLVLVFIVAHTLSTSAALSFPFLNSTVEVVDSNTAAGILGKADAYTRSFSAFDIQGRLQNPAANDIAAYLPHAMKQTRNWTAEEEALIKKAFGEIAEKANSLSLKLNLPAKIYLIKSTTKEEFGAEGYTRGNSIILNPTIQPLSTGLMAHELFHVYSRMNPAKRNDLYAVFGFKACNPIDMKAAFDNRNITNPDCPVVEHYITVDNEDMTLALYSDKKYNGGNVIESYVQVGLLMLQGDGKNKKAKMVNGQVEIKALQDVPGVFAQIGTNTDYLLHIEEVSAEHFSKLITGTTVNQPELLDKFKMVLKQ